MLDSLLADGIDGQPDADGNTPLHLAVRCCCGKVIGDEPLIEEMDAPSCDPSTIATKLSGHLSHHSAAAAQRLHNRDGYMPLHIAVANGCVRICEVLLEADAPINVYTMLPTWLRGWNYQPMGHTCGTWVRQDKTGKVELLPATDKTALHLAVDLLAAVPKENGDDAPIDTTLVRLLLEHGADVDAPDHWNFTPLHTAVASRLAAASHCPPSPTRRQQIDHAKTRRS